jgi:hypothetical protein
VKIRLIEGDIEDAVEAIHRPLNRTLHRLHQDEGLIRLGDEVEDVAIQMVMNSNRLVVGVQQKVEARDFVVMLLYQNYCTRSDRFSDLSPLYLQFTHGHCLNTRKICCSPK